MFDIAVTKYLSHVPVHGSSLKKERTFNQRAMTRKLSNLNGWLTIIAMNILIDFLTQKNIFL